MVNLVLPEEIKRLADFDPNAKPSSDRSWSKIVKKAVGLLLVVALGVGGYFAWHLGYLDSLKNLRLPDLRQSPQAAPVTIPSSSSSASSSAAPSAKLLPTIAPSFSIASNLSKGRIVFVRDGNLWTIDSTGQKQLTKFDQTKELVQFPLLSADVTKILYLDTKVSGSSQAILGSYDGSSTAILADVANDPLDWSADGNSFMSIAAPASTSSLVIRLVSNKGREIRKITTPLDGASCTSPVTWSDFLLAKVYGGSKEDLSVHWLDGNHYLYGTGPCGVTNYKILAEGGSLTPLDPTVVNPRPSLDFTQLVGVSSPSSTAKSIYYYQSDGTLTKKIDLSIAPTDALLSSDKKTIYYSTSSQDDPADPYSFTSTLWKINVDGSSQSKLFDEPHTLRLIPEKISGDGSTLIYTRISDAESLSKSVTSGVTDQNTLAGVAPRVDLMSLDTGLGAKTKLVENGYQPDYSSR